MQVLVNLYHALKDGMSKQKAVMLYQVYLIIAIPLLIHSGVMVYSLSKEAINLKHERPFITAEVGEAMEVMSQADKERVYNDIAWQAGSGPIWAAKYYVFSMPFRLLVANPLQLDPIISVELGCWVFILVMGIICRVPFDIKNLRRLRRYLRELESHGQVALTEHQKMMVGAPMTWRMVIYIIILRVVMESPFAWSHGFLPIMVLFFIFSVCESAKYDSMERHGQLPKMENEEEVKLFEIPVWLKKLGGLILRGRKSKDKERQRNKVKVRKNQTSSGNRTNSQPRGRSGTARGRSGVHSK